MTNNQVIPFAFNDNLIRVFQDEEGKHWWIAKDVCACLDLGNVTEALRNLDDDEKADFSIPEVSSNGVQQDRRHIIINEPGLYSLIFRSRKPEAKTFKRWVTHEVLPAIRKNGSYSTEGGKNDYEQFAACVLAGLKELLSDYGLPNKPSNQGSKAFNDLKRTEKRILALAARQKLISFRDLQHSIRNKSTLLIQQALTSLEQTGQLERGEFHGKNGRQLTRWKMPDIL